MSKQVTAKDVKKLREETGAGMLETRQALQETGGDFAKATEILRKKGELKASRKTDRVAKQGIVDSYIHGEGRIGVLLEVNCETDFVAKNQDFRKLVHDLALQIAASSPLYVAREDVPAENVAKEREIYAEAAQAEGKSTALVEKIVTGRLEKFYEQICLLEQPFIRDQDMTVQELINQSIAKLGENIQVRRFARYVLGE